MEGIGLKALYMHRILQGILQFFSSFGVFGPNVPSSYSGPNQLEIAIQTVVASGQRSTDRSG